MRNLVIVAVALLLGRAAAAADCAVLAETGTPTLAGTPHTTLVCHEGYAALADNDFLVPRWVAYRWTTLHTMGCLKPLADFHGEDLLPPDTQARPEDYRRSGFDRGHMAPPQDFAWDAGLLRDADSMANVAPQLPGLNREGWSRLEQAVDAWAWTRGELVVFSGPILAPGGDSIGHGRIAVPSAFFKVVFDPRSGEALGFVMPQRYVAKGNLAGWVTAIADIEARTGLALPLPDSVDRQARPAPWPAEILDWRRARRLACAP
jgi:endonuclease G